MSRTALRATIEEIGNLTSTVDEIVESVSRGDWPQTANAAIALGGVAIKMLGLLVEKVAYVANRIDSLDDTIQRMDKE